MITWLTYWLYLHRADNCYMAYVALAFDVVTIGYLLIQIKETYGW